MRSSGVGGAGRERGAGGLEDDSGGFVGSHDSRHLNQDQDEEEGEHGTVGYVCWIGDCGSVAKLIRRGLIGLFPRDLSVPTMMGNKSSRVI